MDTAQFDQRDRDALHKRLAASDEAWSLLRRATPVEGYPGWYFDLLGQMLLLGSGEEIEYVSSKLHTTQNPLKAEVIAFTSSRVLQLTANASAGVVSSTAYARSDIESIEIVKSGIFNSEIYASVPKSIKVSTTRHGSFTLPLSERFENGADQVWDLLHNLLGNL